MVARCRPGAGRGRRAAAAAAGPAPPGLPQDIFIRFNPIDNLAQEGQPDPVRFQLVNQRFNTATYRKTHRELRIITFFGGRGTKDPSDQAVQIAQLTRASATAGNTIIVGASAGGFSVLNTAAKLTALGIPIRFIGIADAGFFVDSNDIERFGSPPALATPPTIRLPGQIQADETLNVFQTLGIEALSKKSTPNDRGIAPGAEWFGEMTGFNNQRLTPQNNPKLRTLKTELGPPARCRPPHAGDFRKNLPRPRAYRGGAGGRSAHRRGRRAPPGAVTAQRVATAGWSTGVASTNSTVEQVGNIEAMSLAAQMRGGAHTSLSCMT